MMRACNAVLILRRLVREIVGEAEHGREFAAGPRIEIGVAGVDRAVPNAHIRQAAGAVDTDRYVASDVGHVVVDAGVETSFKARRS
jgi:hypothetical protein